MTTIDKSLSIKITLFTGMVLLAGAPIVRAGNGNDTWTGASGIDSNWGTAGNWSAGSANLPPISGDYLIFDGNTGLTANNNLNATNNFAGEQFNATAGAFTFTGNAVTNNGGILDNSAANTETVDIPMVFPATHSLNATAGGTLLVGGVISGAGGVGINNTATPGNYSGTVTLTNNNTFSGVTTIGNGTLTLDFNAGGAANNIISSLSALSLNGGTLNVNGSANTASSQTFASTTLNAAGSTVSAGTSGSGIPTVALGAITSPAGSTVVFNGPATINSLGNNVTAAANITTTTAGSSGAAAGLLQSSAANPGAFATVGLYDWASTYTTAGTAGSSPYTIIGGSQVPGFYVTGIVSGTINSNWDVTTTTTGQTSTTVYDTMRFNTPGSISFNIYSSGAPFGIGGILVTPNVGVNNVGIGQHKTPGASFQPNRGTAGETVIWQNNTSGALVLTSPYGNAKSGSSSLVQAGIGGVLYEIANTHSASTYINGGYAIANSAVGDGAFGTPATAASLDLNGGTVVASNSWAMDNAGANPRPVVLGVNGGGLDANAGSTLTVDGIVSGFGPLIIGVPASTNNYDTIGLVPSTGDNTANPPGIEAQGTVVLNSTGNTYSGQTIVQDGAILNINSEWALGGANYGGLALNGGSLQYNSTLLNSTVDISLNTVTLTGSDLIDVNGHSIAFANSIGNNGNGSMTLVSSVANGTLTLSGANTYTGGTTVSNLTLVTSNATGSATGSGNVTVMSGTLAGTGIISGAVEIQSGATLAPGVTNVGTNIVGSLQLDGGSIVNIGFSGSPLTNACQQVVTTSGGLNINGGTVYLYQAGTTTPFNTIGTYNLFQYSGSIGGSGISALTVGNPQTGFTYTFGTSGSYVTLKIGVSSSANIGTWGVDANGTWSTAGNWTATAGTMPPRNAGDSATFGTGTALRTVTLDANETVGSITMNNNNSFVIAASGHTLTLDNKGVGVSFQVGGGTADAIQTPVSLNDSTTIAVSATKSVSLSGNIANSSSSETLTLNGAGTVGLSGNNSYGPSAGSVGTVISGGGTVLVGSSSAFGAGDVSVAGNSTIQSGAAGLNLANNVTMASGATTTVNNNGNTITLIGNVNSADNTGGLTENGSGTLILTGNNSFSGPATVNQGILNVGANALNGNGTVNLNGGDLTCNGGSVILNNNVTIGLSSGAVGTNALIDAAAGNTFQFYGPIASAGNTGTENLTINSGTGNNGEVILSDANTFNGTTVISKGTLDLQNAGALQGSTLNYNNQGGTLEFDGSLTSFILGGLTGTENIALTNASGQGVTLSVGTNGAGGIYSGNLLDAGVSSGSGSFIKTGGGTMLLPSTYIFGGAATVNGGVLILTNTTLMDVGSASVSAVGGAQLVVAGGTLVATNSSSIGKPSSGLLITGGNVAYEGGLTTTANNDNNGVIQVNSGVLTTTTMSLKRGGGTGTTQPTAGATTDGLYVDGGIVIITNSLDMSSGTENSSVNARMDAGSLTVDGQVIIGLNNGGRWSVLDINGGTFNATNTTAGVALGSTYSGNADLLVRAGVANVGQVSMGNTNTDNTVVNVTGGTLYIGSGGIIQTSTISTNLIELGGGTLAASAPWSSLVPATLANTNTIQTADSLGNPQNIVLSGGISGTGNLVKSGSGILTLNNTNAYVGFTTVSGGDLQLIAPANLDGTNFTAITLAAPSAVLDLSSAGYLSGGLTLVTNSTLYLTNASQILTGEGTIFGSLLASNGTTVTVGVPTGTLNVTNGVELAGAVNLNLDLALTATNSELVAPTISVDLTATLNVANVGPALVAGDSFQLFNHPVSFANGNVTLPALSSGLGWTNKLTVNGSIAVVQTALIPTVSPAITNFSLAGANVVISGNNAQAGATYYLLTTTNLPNPPSAWKTIATNVLPNNNSYTFIGTNAVASPSHQFYMLSSTNFNP